MLQLLNIFKKPHLSITITLCVICNLLVTYSWSQDMTGVWQGKFYSSGLEGLTAGTYKYEVQIADDDGKLKGVTYSYLSTIFYGKASLVGFSKEQTATVVIKETKMLEMKNMDGGDGCLMTCTLSYSKKGDEAYLTGTYTSVNMYTGTACGGGKVFLHKTDKTDFHKEKFLLDHKPKTPPVNVEDKEPTTSPTIKPVNPIDVKKPVINPPIKPKTKPTIDTTTKTIKKIDKPIINIPKDTVKQQLPDPKNINVNPKKIDQVQAPKEIRERTNQIQKIIYTNADSINIQLYDNGQIDGDIVTVYDNNRLVVSKQLLGLKPIVVKIAINPQDPHHELVLVADNLGDIPPNTSLMIVNAGSKRYEVQLSSTEQQNAKVIFEYRKEP